MPRGNLRSLIPEPQMTHTSDNKLVLIVDDTPTNVGVISGVLKGAYRTKVATNGEKALVLASAADKPDLILLDVMMPGMDGYEITRRLRADERFRRLPVLALTAKAMKGDREKCLQAGASDYLAKPVNTEQLLSALRMWLHR